MSSGAIVPILLLLVLEPRWIRRNLCGALAKLDAEQYLDVRFEDLVTRPKEVMQQISAFFDLPSADPDWIDRAAQIVKGSPPTRFDELPASDREALQNECRSGQLLLERGF